MSTMLEWTHSGWKKLLLHIYHLGVLVEYACNVGLRSLFEFGKNIFSKQVWTFCSVALRSEVG